MADINFPNSIDRSASEGMTKEEMLNRVNAGSKSALNADEIFGFRMNLSNRNRDSFYTRMSERTLDNYVTDFSKGAPLNLIHNDRRLPIGKIFHAERSGSNAAAYSYIQRGLTLDGQDTDSVIRAIEGGTLNDVSVRFNLDHNSRLICSRCGVDVMRSVGGHDHFPGQVTDNGDVVEYEVDNAHGVEGSLVGKGSTPGAVITDVIRSYRDEYRISKVNHMDLSEVRAALALDNDEQIIATIRQLQTNFKALSDKQPDLEKRAKLGDDYIASLIEQAIAQRVRAEGQGSFDEDNFRQMLVRLNDTKFISEIITGYKTTADKVFANGEQRHQDVKNIKPARANSGSYK